MSQAIQEVGHSFATIVSRKTGQALALWGEPGIGKTFNANATLREIPCPQIRLPANTSSQELLQALPQPKKLPIWAKINLEKLNQGENLKLQALLDTVMSVLCGLAPVVLYLEDLHEASLDHQEFVCKLAQAILKTRGVGLLVTSRTKPSSPFRSYRLEPLPASEIQAILEHQIAGLPPEGIEWIQSRTHGNPLFTLEFLRYLRRQGAIWSDGQRWHWRAPASDFVPITVEVMIEEVIQDAAITPVFEVVIGARVMLEQHSDTALWAKISQLEPDALEAVRSQLEQRGLLRGAAFAHPLYFEIATRLMTTERQVLARRALEALEHDPQTAVRFIEAANLTPDETKNRFVRAAQAAETIGQLAQAGQWLARAIDYTHGQEREELARKVIKFLKHTDTPAIIRFSRMVIAQNPNDLEATLELLGCLAQLGELTEIEQILERLPLEIKSQAAWLTGLIKLRMAQGDFKEVLKVWNQHQSLQTQPDPLTANAVGFAKMILGDHEGAEVIVRKGLEIPNLPERVRAQLLAVLGLSQERRDQLQAARTNLDQAVACARLYGKPVALASTLYNRQIILERLMLVPEMLADLQEAMELYQQAGETQKYASTLCKLGVVLTDLEQYETAESKLLEARESLLRLGDSRFLITCETSLSQLYMAWQPPHGQQLALKSAKQALQMARQAPLSHKLAVVLETMSKATTWHGQAQHGLELAEESLGLAITDLEKIHALIAKSQALEALGYTSKAINLLEQAMSIAVGYHVHLLHLELARLNNNLKTGRLELEWFQQNNLMAMVNSTLRKWSDLIDSPTKIVIPEPLVTPARLEVLGTFQLERDGQTLKYRGHRRSELLAYLLEARIAGRNEVSWLDLIETFYPNQLQADAKRTLRQQVYLIRSDLGKDCILSTSNGYALGAVSSDAEDFLLTNEPELWRGLYLEHLSDGWFSGVRDALTLALRSTVERLIQTNTFEAARLGRILLELEPYDLEILRLCVLALSSSGEKRAASSLFRESRAQLLALEENLPETLEVFLSAPVLLG